MLLSKPIAVAVAVVAVRFGALASSDTFALATQNAFLFAKVAPISMGVKTVSLLLETRCELPKAAQLPEFCEFA